MNNNRQAAPALVMRRPANFGFNAQTAVTNVFQEKADKGEAALIPAQAIKEFDAFVSLLRKCGVEVLVFEDAPEDAKPDALFVNNWVSFHSGGKVILYPMLTPNRREERSHDLLKNLTIENKFSIDTIVDFSKYEQQGLILEGTGSVVLDYPNEKIYANYSSRTHSILLDKLAEELSYDLIAFDAKCPDGSEIYHTNVLMCIADKYVIICDGCIYQKEERSAVLTQLSNDGHQVIKITYEQMTSFAGNMLEVSDKEGNSLLVMSDQAYDALGKDQIQSIHKYSKIIHAPLSTIEKYGGGSARCMMAANFLANKG